MASINILASGRYRVRIHRAGRFIASKSFERLADAQGWARKTERELDTNTWKPPAATPSQVPLGEVLERYAQEVTPTKRGARAEAFVVINVLARECIARLPISGITTRDVEAVRDDWTRKGLAPGTIKRRMTTLRNVFTVAEKRWHLQGIVNPVVGLEMMPEPDERTRRVSEQEIEAICSATLSIELPHFIRLAVATAMRRGELCGLRWEHVDLEARTAHLPVTKNGRPRTVPLSSRAVEILRAPPRRDSGTVFASSPNHHHASVWACGCTRRHRGRPPARPAPRGDLAHG